MIIEYFKHSLDWEILQARTEKWGWQRGVCLMLAMTQQLLEIDLPDSILIWIKNNLVNTNIQVVAQKILLENQQNSKLATLSLTIFSSDLSLIQRIKLSTQRIFLSSAIMSQTYAMSFSYFSLKLYFYYLIRIRDYLIYLRNLWFYYQPVIKNTEKTNLDFLSFKEEKYLLHQWLQEKSD